MLTISFIIPVKPSGTVRALETLRLLDCQEVAFEVLVAEGTVPSRQRNVAVQQARGELIYFLDDDSRLAAGNLAICIKRFSDPAVAVVGGPSLPPPDDSQLQLLFGFALSSLFGAGAIRNRYRAAGVMRETTERELILCNLVVRREIFLEAGGFDERLYPNEENELLDRLGKSHKLIHDPELVVWRSQRSTLTAFMRQMFTYGRGRAEQTLLTARCSVISLIPLIFLFYLASLPGLLLLSPLWLFPMFVYALLDVAATVASVKQSGRFVAILLAPLFPLMHCCNGWGLLYGLVRGAPHRPREGTVAVRQLKSFEDAVW